MSSKFNILSSIIEDEKIKWYEIWKQSEEKDVFLNPEYAILYNKCDEVAKCAILQTENTTIIYSFIQRKISTLNSEIDYYDIITPYGYGGAQYSGEKSEKIEDEFNKKFEEWCRENNIVSEFIRFTLFAENLIKYNGLIEENNLNIVCNLEKEEEDIWKEFKHKVRKNVKKAKDSNISIKIDEYGETLNEFIKIYYETMDRNNANSQYYFSEDYFKHIVDKLSGSYMIINAIKDEKVISSELILLSNKSMYSFLGGTKSEYFDYRPNDLLKYEAILWGKKKGINYYVLGGGYKREDGIYKYKLAFEPNGTYIYKVGKRILNQNMYDIICDEKLKEKTNEEIDKNYFPLYRI